MLKCPNCGLFFRCLFAGPPVCPKQVQAKGGGRK